MQQDLRLAKLSVASLPSPRVLSGQTEEVTGERLAQLTDDQQGPRKRVRIVRLEVSANRLLRETDLRPRAGLIGMRSGT
jgi:hypothetical protein